jgi:hypothetical protein
MKTNDFEKFATSNAKFKVGPGKYYQNYNMYQNNDWKKANSIV